MLNKIKNRKQEGFTIIEVLIVLAIAGLIMLIVFLAVPALQRSSRNRGREADASLIANAVNSCLTNNNGKVASCKSVGTDNVSFDTAKVSQLTTAPTYAASLTDTGSNISAKWYFKARCDGNSPSSTGATDRDFVVTFKVEEAGGDAKRCINI